MIDLSLVSSKNCLAKNCFMAMTAILDDKLIKMREQFVAGVDEVLADSQCS